MLLCGARVTVCCSVLQRVAACCSALYVLLSYGTCRVCSSVLQCIAACCSMLQRVAIPCSVLQRVAACCSASHVLLTPWRGQPRMANSYLGAVWPIDLWIYTYDTCFDLCNHIRIRMGSNLSIYDLVFTCILIVVFVNIVNDMYFKISATTYQLSCWVWRSQNQDVWGGYD